MTDDLLSYDPARMSALALRTRAAVDDLNGVSSGDPAAASAVATVRDVAHRLSTSWLPMLSRIAGDDSMTGWDADGAGDAAPRGFRASGPVDLDDMTHNEFLAALAEAAAAEGQGLVIIGGPPIPHELLAELEQRWDDLEDWQRAQAIGALVAFGGWSMLVDDLSFLEDDIGDMYITPGLVNAVVESVASGNTLPPELQPLADRIAEEYATQLAMALHGVDDPATAELVLGENWFLFIGLSPAKVEEFLATVDPELRAAIEQRYFMDTSGFTLEGSIVVDSPDGTPWSEAVLYTGSAIGFYDGGGFAIGPDGQPYPLVVPTVVTGDDTYTADATAPLPGEPSVANLGGAEEGWEVVGCATGVERIFPAPGLDDYVGFFLAGTAVSLSVPPSSDELPNINVNPGEMPYLTAEAASAGQPVDIPPVDEAGPSSAGVGVLSTAANAGVVLTGLDNQNCSAYSIVFEQSADGDRRARLVIYNLGQDASGDIVVVPNHLYVNDDGDLVQQGVSYGNPYSAAPIPEGATVLGLNTSGYDYAPFVLRDAVIP